MQTICHTGLKTRTYFRKRAQPSIVETLDHAQLYCAPEGPAWRGLELVAGMSSGWFVEDVVTDGHYVGINLSEEPLHLQVGGPDGWTSVVMPPGSLWINSDGQPFSICVQRPSFWAGARIERQLLDGVVGHHCDLNPGFGVIDDLLRDVFRALIRQGEPDNMRADHEGTLARSLIRAFVLALGKRHGRAVTEPVTKSGLTRYQLSVLSEWIEANLEKPFSVEDLAALVGLTPAHFSRAFKRSTGSAPWQRVMHLRLQRAAALLRDGEPISSIAHRCGFSDQAHLTRTFRQHFGVTPREYVRELEI
jgi:AraC-like DNA-binding protein